LKTTKKAKPGPRAAPVLHAPSPIPREWQRYGFSIAAVFLIAYIVYGPSLSGEFVFDDLHLPFFDHNAMAWPLKVWWGVRPLLMTTYWANLHLSGLAPFSYHALNVFLHACATILLFLAVRRILDLAKVDHWKATPLAAFAAGVFLLHPIQTEAVSYVAQRGEELGAVFYFAAFCAFLYRGTGAVTWARTVTVVALFGLAVITKEHTVTLPALLLLTDYFWNPGFTLDGIKRNWRLYLVIAAGFVAGVAFVWRYVSRDTVSVGFQLPDFTAPQYLFTEFRVFFAYLGLFVWPLWQTIDYDFSVSHTILEHGAIIALALILLLVAAAFRYRRAYPLAAYGFIVFLVLLLPTSSIIPIKDPIADRRLYLPMIGLLFIVLEVLRRWDVKRNTLIAVCAAICLLLGAGSYRRNEQWSSSLALWADAAEKAPEKQRVQFGLAVAQFFKGQCRESIEHYQKAISLGKPDFQFWMNLGMAYDCDHQPGKALEALKKANEIRPMAQTWASMALVEARQGQMQEPLDALDQAEHLDPSYAMTYVYRGGIMQAIGRLQDAAIQYRRALALDPGNVTAQRALASLSSAAPAPLR
jgi:tetratricopeptide (TPR) repeat protein